MRLSNVSIILSLCILLIGSSRLKSRLSIAGSDRSHSASERKTTNATAHGGVVARKTSTELRRRGGMLMGGGALAWIAIHVSHGYCLKIGAFYVKKTFVQSVTIGAHMAASQVLVLVTNKVCHYFFKLIMLYVLHLKEKLVNSKDAPFVDPIQQELDRIWAMGNGEMPKEHQAAMLDRAGQELAFGVVQEPFLIEGQQNMMDVSHGFDIMMKAFNDARAMSEDELRKAVSGDPKLEQEAHTKFWEGVKQAGMVVTVATEHATAHMVCKFLSQMTRMCLGGHQGPGGLLPEAPSEDELKRMAGGAVFYLAANGARSWFVDEKTPCHGSYPNEAAYNGIYEVVDDPGEDSKMPLLFWQLKVWGRAGWTRAQTESIPKFHGENCFHTWKADVELKITEVNPEAEDSASVASPEDPIFFLAATPMDCAGNYELYYDDWWNKTKFDLHDHYVAWKSGGSQSEGMTRHMEEKIRKQSQAWGSDDVRKQMTLKSMARQKAKEKELREEAIFHEEKYRYAINCWCDDVRISTTIEAVFDIWLQTFTFPDVAQMMIVSVKLPETTLTAKLDRQATTSHPTYPLASEIGERLRDGTGARPPVDTNSQAPHKKRRKEAPHAERILAHLATMTAKATESAAKKV